MRESTGHRQGEEGSVPPTAGVEDSADWTADVDSVTLRAIAANWLRYHRQCRLVTFERGPNYGDRPDVYGINESRYGVEIEIKVSLSDFKRDLSKRKWVYQFTAPAFFYFMVPRRLVEKVQGLLPEGVGLLTTADGIRDPYTHLPALRCKVAPKRNPKAKRIPVSKAIEMVRNQSGTLCSLAVAQANFYRSANAPEAEGPAKPEQSFLSNPAPQGVTQETRPHAD